MGYVGYRTIMVGMAVLSVSIIPVSLLAEDVSVSQKIVSETLHKKRYSPIFIDGKTIPKEVLLNDEAILAFVSHPKVLSNFLEARAKDRESALALVPDVERLRIDFSSDREVQAFVGRFYYELKGLTQPLPFEDIVAPFLVFGIGDTSNITDQKTLKEVQKLQVKLFKNWLSRYKIGSPNKNIFNELKIFSRESSLELFSKVIYPLLVSLESRESDLEDIIDYYIGDDRGDYDNSSDEEKVDLPPEIQEAIAAAASVITKEMFPEGEVDANEEEQKPSAGEKAIQKLLKKFEFSANAEEYTSRDAIIRLFLKITQIENNG